MNLLIYFCYLMLIISKIKRKNNIFISIYYKKFINLIDIRLYSLSVDFWLNYYNKNKFCC